MPYTDDANGNNTYTVDYRLSPSGSWTNWVTAAAHTTSPYATTITGLTASTSHDVRVTYIDADGVTGANPQTISGVITGRLRLYLQNANSSVTTTNRGAWDSATGYPTLVMSRTKSGAITSRGVAETSGTNNYDVLVLKLVSEPMLAQTIAAGSTLIG